MEVFAARHPIFDAQKEVFGYELQFRSGFEDYYNALNADTAAVDFMAFVNFGELVDGKMGLVNFARSLVMKGFPALLPQESTIPAIEATEPPDEPFVAALTKLRDKYGYRLAVRSAAQSPAAGLLQLADFVQVDFASTDEDYQRQVGETHANSPASPMAINVRTPEQFDKAVAWGYTYFQGDFFTTPVVQPGRKITSEKFNYVRLLNQVNRPDLSYEEIEEIIKQDVAMAYKLLQFMNSAWFGLRYEIHSVKHALVMLGPQEIRRWISVVAVRSVGEDKPRELLLRSLARAHVAERLAPMAKLSDKASDLFLLGMFSLIDALLDLPMPEALAELPLDEQIKAALLGNGGPLAPFHALMLSYEKGDWTHFSVTAEALGVDESAIPTMFRDAIKWANEALGEL